MVERGRVQQGEIHPDAERQAGFHSVCPDNDRPVGLLINKVLGRAGSDKRARVVLHEDAIAATGVWTQREADEVIARLETGPDGNYADPKKKKGIRRPLQYLGLIM